MTDSGTDRKARAAVVVMAKDPQPGHVKTRMCPPLSEDEATSLYAAMLADRCDQVRTLDGAHPAIAFADGEREPVACADGFERVGQPDGGLGEGLKAAARHFLSRGIPTVLVDSDSPTLPRDRLQEAVDAVRNRDYDLVIGPAEDGGYHLIGLSVPAYGLFDDIPWSTSDVVTRTLARASQLSLLVRMLKPWRDVDDGDDLNRLDEALMDSWWPHHTAQWLRRRRFPPRAAAEQAPAADAMWRMPWTTDAQRSVYSTPWLKIREDLVTTPSGDHTTYSVVDCGECVGILPFVDEDTVLMVRQYRYIAGRVTWEMPTGGVHRGESPEQAARRELAEEAQVRAGELISLGAYHTSKSVMDETAHLYTATALSPCSADGDEFEFIRAERIPFAQVLDWVQSGEIVDSMTIIAVLRVALARATR